MVAPTVTMLAVMKARLTGATKGHALLKKKADALTMRFRWAVWRPQSAAHQRFKAFVPVVVDLSTL